MVNDPAGANLVTDAPVLDIAGFCPICEADTRFVASNTWFRDTLECAGCRSVPRERALMMVIDLLYPEWRSLAIHESSPGDRGTTKKLERECANYCSSQYDPSIPWGSINPSLGHRSENLEAQTFADGSFDLVITQDVFEHIFHPGQAMREIARTLKPGGAHIGTVPIVRKRLPSRRRAQIGADGVVQHLLPAEYHNNPVDAGGSLVTIDWGYDIAGYMTRESGLSTLLFSIDDLTRGVRAEYLEVMVNQNSSAAQDL